MAAWNWFSYICIWALHYFWYFAHWRAASTVIPLLPKDTFAPTSLTSVSLVPILHWLWPSTPFWPYSTNPFFPHAQTISILSDLLYSLTPFLFQLSNTPLHSYLDPFVTLKPNFSNTSSQEHSLSFSQHFSYHMPLLRTMPLVQLLYHIDTSWPLSQTSIAQDTFQCSSSSIPLIHSVYHIPFTSSIGCHLRPQVLKTIHNLIFVTCESSSYLWVQSVQPTIKALYLWVRCIYMQEHSVH